MQIKVNTKSLERMLDRARDQGDELVTEAYIYFREQTPKRSGNARRQTKIVNNSIVADYAYAQPLDQGSSKQAPNGMVDPTVEHIERVLVPKAIRRATNGQ